jgi:hypothetical protein
MDGQFEIVIYRLKGDLDRGQFLEISARATEWLRNRPGYLGRELLEDDSGLWVDLVRWATIEDALAAANAFMAVPEAAAFMDAVEPESITMLHPRRVVIDELPQSSASLGETKETESRPVRENTRGDQAMTRGMPR